MVQNPTWGGHTADISDPEKSGDIHSPMAQSMFFQEVLPILVNRFCHAIPIIFTEDVSPVLSLIKSRNKRNGLTSQANCTQLQYQTWPIGRKYRQLKFKLVSYSTSKWKSEPMKSQKPPFGMSARNLYFECIKET
jgi:hypothetical protein